MKTEAIMGLGEFSVDTLESKAAPSAKNAPLMEIAHIVMGWQNEDEAAHVRMLNEIEELIARSDGGGA